jgi:hypothetical protein
LPEKCGSAIHNPRGHRFCCNPLALCACFTRD